MDVLAGAASGGIMAGGANAYAHHHYKQLGKHVNADAKTKNEIIEAAGKMQDNTVAKQIVTGKEAENINASDMTEILSSMAEEVENESIARLEERFAELGEDKQQAKKDAKEIYRAVTTSSEDVGSVENAVRIKKFEKNENLQKVYREELAAGKSSAASALTKAEREYQAEKYYKKAKKRRRKEVVQATDTDTGEKVAVIGIEVNTAKRQPEVKLSDGRTMKLSDVKITDTRMQDLYNSAATLNDKYASNAMIERYAGESMDTYLESCAVFFNAGKLGTTSFDAMMKNPMNARLISNISNPATLKMMYEQGKNHAQAEKAIQMQQETAPESGNIRTEQGGGKVIDNRLNRTDNRMKHIAESVAKKTGITITLNESLEHGEQGHFQKSLARIALSSESKNEYTTLVHELNEFAESYNPEGMKKVIDTVLDYAQTKEGAAYLTERVQQYQKAYKRVESDKTYREASEEFVFDYLAGVFSTEDGVKDFTRYMTEENMTEKEQKGIIETIADFFKELFEHITSYLEDHVLSDTAKKGLQAEAEKAKEIREMVLDAWSGAIANSKEKPAEYGDKRYSIDIKAFEKEYDAWDKKDARKIFKVAKTSDALRSIGVKNADITMDAVKIMRI